MNDIPSFNDPALPFVPVGNSGTTCSNSGGCGPTGVSACIGGAQSGLPVAGPMVVNCFGSIGPVNMSCVTLPSCS